MDDDRHHRLATRRAGRSGLVLSALSLGLWQGTGSYAGEATTTAIVRTAFDHGITHFDLANNYGDPPGTSELLFGRILRDLPRHEVTITTKAGYRMWPGPHGEGGSRKYLIESCEQSLRRMGVDHVDVFYSHRFDPDTPIEETLGALDHLVRQGKATYAGLSNWKDPHLGAGLDLVRARQWAPITLHQPRYHLLDRGAEREVFPTAAAHGVGIAVFSPLAQGLLTDKYMHGIPPDSRARLGTTHVARAVGDAATMARIARLADLARQRGEPLARMALAWVLRDPRVTTAIIGASKPDQVIDACLALRCAPFTGVELAAIDAAVA